MFFCRTEDEDLEKQQMLLHDSVTGCGLIRGRPKLRKIPPDRKRILNSTELKMVFRLFTRKEAVFGKTNDSPFCFLLRPTYEQNMS